MSKKIIEAIEVDGQVYLEFGYTDEDELLLLEFDLVTKEGTIDVLS